MAKHPSGTKGPSKTRSEFQEEAHLPTMMKRWRRQGVLAEVLRQPRHLRYGDYSNVGDYREALEAVEEARAAFMQLDPRVRLHFENDPQRLLEALEDAERVSELVELGILEAPGVEAPVEPAAPAAPQEDPEDPPSEPAA